MNKVSVTFYDIVGYVIPGFVGLISIAVCISIINNNMSILINLQKLNIVWQIGLSYVFGHVIQAVVSFVWKNDYTKHFIQIGFESAVADKFKNIYSEVLGSSTEKIGHFELAMSDLLVVDEKALGKASVFRAFQGMYKGVVGALSLIAAEIIFMLASCVDCKIDIPDLKVDFGKSALIYLFIIISLLLLVSVKRHNDFVKSRLRVIVISVACKT